MPLVEAKSKQPHSQAPHLPAGHIIMYIVTFHDITLNIIFFEVLCAFKSIDNKVTVSTTLKTCEYATLHSMISVIIKRIITK